MGNRRIADLHAALTWDLDDFERGTGRIESGFNKLIGKGREMADKFRSIGRDMTLALTVPIAGLATGFAVAAKGMAEDALAIRNSARLAGSGFEDFQRHAYAAREVGVEFEKLTDIFKDVQDKFGDFIANGGGEMQDFFEHVAPKVGVTAEMFKSLSGKDALQLYFDSLRKANVSQAEMIFYLEAVADEASLLIPLLEDSGRAFDELGAKAPVISEEEADTLLRYREALKDLTDAFRRVTIAVVESGLLQSLTDILETIARSVGEFAEANPALFRFAAGALIVLAALGPLATVLTTLAFIALPLFLARLSPVFFALSALINPIGTLLVFLSKLVGGFSGLIGGIGRVIPFLGRMVLSLARLHPVAAVLITIFTLFGDKVVGALGRLWDRAKQVLGPAFEKLLTNLSHAVEAVIGAFTALGRTQLGQFLGKVIEVVGDLVAALLELGGGVVIFAIELLIRAIAGILRIIEGVVTGVYKLLSGDFAGAWQIAKSAVVDAIAGMFPAFQNLWNWIHDTLARLGLMDERVKEATGQGSGDNDKGAPSTKPKGRDWSGFTPYTLPEKGKKGGAKKTRTGPSKEELADRREEIRLEQELELARLRNDQDAIKALERQKSLKDRIEQYERAGLKAAEAKAAAERDFADIDRAKLAARDEFLARREDELDLQLAQLRGDWQHLDDLEAEEYLRRAIVELQEDGFTLIGAERIAQAELLRIEQARAENAAQRLRDQKAAHDIELARLRGDDVLARRLEEDRRVGDRTEELQRDFGYSRAEAEAEAIREASDRARAHVQGNFRSAFRDGLRAAMDGNFWGWFKDRLKDASFNALAKALDRLADRLADMVFGQQGGGSGGGGLFSFLGSLFGGGGGGEPANLLSGTPYDVPGFATGGSFKIRGFSGVDRNILSLNGRPVAKVGNGEIMDVRKGENGAAGTHVFAPNIYAPGADAAQLRRVEEQLVALNDSVEGRAVSAVRDFNQRTFGQGF
ncbi:hypothetical protein [Qipengyuania sp.]|uniref:phage tail protein n=1 Tax=Qipengyuania sp. TaxID=2004515 RepID=UPI00351457FD